MSASTLGGFIGKPQEPVDRHTNSQEELQLTSKHLIKAKVTLTNIEKKKHGKFKQHSQKTCWKPSNSGEYSLMARLYEKLILAPAVGILLCAVSLKSMHWLCFKSSYGYDYNSTSTTDMMVMPNIYWALGMCHLERLSRELFGDA